MPEQHLDLTVHATVQEESGAGPSGHGAILTRDERPGACAGRLPMIAP